LAVEHLKDGEFFFLKPEVLQPHRVFHHPIASPKIVLAPRHQIGSLSNEKLPSGAGNQTVLKSDHSVKYFGLSDIGSSAYGIELLFHLGLIRPA
jgi:hypothetical protein